MPVQFICKFNKVPIKTKRACSGQGQICFFFGTKGQVTPKGIVQSGQNSNFSEIICLSRLPVNLIKIQLKLKQLYLDKILHNTVFFGGWHSMASNSKVNGPFWPKFKDFLDFIPILVTCKFDKDPTINRGAILLTTFSPL